MNMFLKTGTIFFSDSNWPGCEFTTKRKYSLQSISLNLIHIKKIEDLK